MTASGRRNIPAEYALTMYANDVTGAPASYAFEAWNPTGSPLQSLARVAPAGRDGRISGTRPSRPRDAATMQAGPIHVSDALKMSRADEFESVKEVVTRCERLLALAKAGKIRGVAYAMVQYQDGSDNSPVGWTWAVG